MAWTVQHGDYGRTGADWPVLLKCSLVLVAQCPCGQTLPPTTAAQISLLCHVNSILFHFVLWGCAGVRRSLHMSKGQNVISRLPGCSMLLWQEQVEGQLSILLPRTRLPAQPGSRAGKRFQQPGKPAEQRTEAKPAQVKGNAKPARLCFIALPLGQQVLAGKDWEHVLLDRSHWASELLRVHHSLNEQRLRDWTRTKTGGLCNGIQLNGWMAHLVGWGQVQGKAQQENKSMQISQILEKWGFFSGSKRDLLSEPHEAFLF